jgi:RNase P/RNase MRP subunit p30
MPMDIVFPESNEKEFAEMAEKLGYDELVFVYRNQAPKPDASSKVKVRTGLLALPKEIDNARKKSDLIIVKSSFEKDRWVLEKSKAGIVFGLEESQRKDYMHHRGSGLNQVLCKIAAQKGKTIGFSFSSVLNSNSEGRARIIGRMRQNAMFCRKYKVKTVLASFARSPYEMRVPKDMDAFRRLIGL